MTRLQYCRYCRHCFGTEGSDTWLCDTYDKEVPKRRGTKPNSCPGFEFCMTATDDPYLIYKPRPRRSYEQLHMEDDI